MNYILNGKKTVHCLFEQSGIFKNTLKNFGFNAIDYDIKNDYDETDVKIDLFTQIENAIEGRKSIFDEIKKDDVILAFFPCTYFSDQSQLTFSGKAYQMQKYTLEKKLWNCTSRMFDLAWFYKNLCYLIILCIKKQIPLIIENPYGKQNFLGKYFPLNPGLIIKDRSLYGDFYKKPTQFFFVNCELEFSLFWSNPNCAFRGAIETITSSRERSEISADFAMWFVENVMKCLYKVDDNKVERECI